MTDDATFADQICPERDADTGRRTAPTPPPSLDRRPRDRHGRIAPWFIAKVNGEWDHRIVDGRRTRQAINGRRCWLCGEHITGREPLAFTIGPMCAINRISAEPPSHHQCATYAVQACPFLSRPHMDRSKRDYPEGHRDAPGESIKRNPGVVLIYLTDRYTPIAIDHGYLMQLGPIIDLEWWTMGRHATRDEVLHSVHTGIPALRELAMKDGPQALRECDASIDRAFTIITDTTTAPDTIRA